MTEPPGSARAVSTPAKADAPEHVSQQVAAQLAKLEMLGDDAALEILRTVVGEAERNR